MAVSAAIELIDIALKATTAYDRPDLGARLAETRERLADPTVRVLVVGEFKQGKSQLVNALISATVCPVDDDIATAVPTLVRHAEQASATLVRESGGNGSAQRTDIAFERLADYVSEAGNAAQRAGVTYVEVGIPRNILADGLVLVDTPGVGGLGSPHGAATMAALTGADAVLLVSDASQEYTKPELDFLDAAMQLCPNVACVVTKTDLYPHWRRITDLDRGHLGRAGVRAELLPVSSTLRLHALQVQDKELNEESGFPALISFLRGRVVAESDLLDRRSAQQDVLAVCEQVSSTFSAELEAQQNPEKIQELVAELERTKARAADLKSRGARWQLTLNDGVGDLQSDIDFDLRDRLRHITREAEELVDASDPAETWDQFAAWVQQQVASAASANFVWAAQRARHLAEQVAEHFAEGGTNLLPELTIDTSGGIAPRVSALEQPTLEKVSIGAKAMSGMRGGYMGALMIGMLTTMAGLALINPISIGAGVALGAKGVRDDKKRALVRRQFEAKAAMRRHLDEVQFAVGKDSRDMLRRMQRTLRDHFASVAEELHTSVTGSVNAAQSAVRTTESERNSRIADLQAELERLEALATRARALAKAA